MSKLRQNLIYNTIHQILTLIFPLITVPYISRILGADGVGVYSFTYSIVYYFMLISLLGINNHGNRAIAKARENPEKLSKTFSSIYTIQLVASISMTLLYALYLLLFSPDYLPIAQIQMIYIISAIFDINWFFFGLEEFKLTVTRNIVIKILSIIAIFLFVKTSADVWIYALIMASSTLLSQLVMWPLLLKKIKLRWPGKQEILKHIKPCLVLFIPVIAVSLYKVMDKIMLGAMTDMSEVGYYEQAEKITNIPLALITALGTVMMPRMSNLAAKGHEVKMKEYIKKSVAFMMFLAFPVCFGLIVVANNFVPIFLGNGFVKSILLLQLLSITILFLAFANMLRTGYIIPKEKDGAYVRITITGAIVNLIINFLLIPHLQSVGACIGTIVAELAVTLYQMMVVRKDLPVMSYFRNIMQFFLKALFMFVVTWLIGKIPLPPAVAVALQIGAGVITYAVLNIEYIKEIVDLRVLKRRLK